MKLKLKLLATLLTLAIGQNAISEIGVAIPIEAVRSRSESVTNTLPTLHVISVGVGEFRDKGIGRLTSSNKDAQDIADAFKGGRTNVLVTTASESRKSIILGMLSEVGKKATDGDTVLFFYSGLGMLDEIMTPKGTMYEAFPKPPLRTAFQLVPFDATCTDTKCNHVRGTITFEEIWGALGFPKPSHGLPKLGNKNTPQKESPQDAPKSINLILIFDADHAGGLANELAEIYTDFGGRYSIAFIGAATATQSALDGQTENESSPFAAVVKTALSTPECNYNAISLGDCIKKSAPNAKRFGVISTTPVTLYFGSAAFDFNIALN